MKNGYVLHDWKQALALQSENQVFSIKCHNIWKELSVAKLATK